MATNSRLAASRRPRSPWWSSANSPSAPSSPKTTSKSSPPSARTDCPHAQPYKGTWFRDVNDIQKSMRPAPPDGGEEANEIVARAKTGTAAIESIKAETQRMGPPPLYDLTDLQRHANRLFGFSAQKTLDTRAGPLRKAQAHQLSAHRQPPPFAGRRGHPAAHRASHRGPYRRAARARHRRAPAGPPLRRRRQSHATTTPSSPPPRRPATRPVAGRSTRSTTSSAAACSAPGTTITSGR